MIITNESSYTCLQKRNSQQRSITATNSASVEDRVTWPSAFDLQAISTLMKKTIQPVIERLSSLFPGKSPSDFPTRKKCFCHSFLNQSLILIPLYPTHTL